MLFHQIIVSEYICHKEIKQIKFGTKVLVLGSGFCVYIF